VSSFYYARWSLYTKPRVCAANVACFALYVSAYYCICVRILLHMCPHTTMPGGACIPSRAYAPQMSPALRYVSAYYYICVLILLHMCPHTTAYVSSYYYARWSVYTKPRVCAANVVVELIPVLQAMVCKTVYVS
jgi:hypothetical protein